MLNKMFGSVPLSLERRCGGSVGLWTETQKTSLLPDYHRLTSTSGSVEERPALPVSANCRQDTPAGLPGCLVGIAVMPPRRDKGTQRRYGPDVNQGQAQAEGSIMLRMRAVTAFRKFYAN